MAAIISKEDILKSIQTMSIDDRMKLIGEIAALPESSEETRIDTKSTENESNIDPKLAKISQQVMDKYDDLFHRLATWTEDTSQKTK